MTVFIFIFILLFITAAQIRIRWCKRNHNDGQSTCLFVIVLHIKLIAETRPRKQDGRCPPFWICIIFDYLSPDHSWNRNVYLHAKFHRKGRIDSYPVTPVSRGTTQLQLTMCFTRCLINSRNAQPRYALYWVRFYSVDDSLQWRWYNDAANGINVATAAPAAGTDAGDGFGRCRHVPPVFIPHQRSLHSFRREWSQRHMWRRELHLAVRRGCPRWFVSTFIPFLFSQQSVSGSFYLSVDCLLAWLIDWLIDWFIHSFIH